MQPCNPGIFVYRHSFSYYSFENLIATGSMNSTLVRSRSEMWLWRAKAVPNCWNTPWWRHHTLGTTSQRCWFSEMLGIDKRIRWIEVMSKKGCWTENANKMLYIFLICIAGIYRVLKSGRDVWIEMFKSYWKETLFHHIQSQWDCRCHEVFMPLCRGETSSAHHRTAPRQTGCDWIDSNRRKMFFAVKPREGTLFFETQKSCCVFLLLQNWKLMKSQISRVRNQWLLSIHSWRSCEMFLPGDAN